MRGGDDDVLRAGILEDLHGAGDRAARVDHVVDQHADAALDVPDHGLGLGLVRNGEVPALVHEAQRHAAQAVRPLLRHAHATGVRGDHRDLLALHAGADVVRQQRDGEQVVHRAVEEALDLGGVQVHAHHAGGAGGLVQVRDETGRDRLAAAALLVLAGVRVERRDHRDAAGGGALHGVHHDQLLHEVVVQRRRVRLDDEHVLAAHRLARAHVDLAVGEVVGAHGEQLGAQLLGDLLRELGVGAARGQHQSLVLAAAQLRHDVLIILRGCTFHARRRRAADVQRAA